MSETQDGIGVEPADAVDFQEPDDGVVVLDDDDEETPEPPAFEPPDRRPLTYISASDQPEQRPQPEPGPEVQRLLLDGDDESDEVEPRDPLLDIAEGHVPSLKERFGWSGDEDDTRVYADATGLKDEM